MMARKKKKQRGVYRSGRIRGIKKEKINCEGIKENDN